ncbi:unnamed protein product, partial [Lota lota]
LPAGPRAAEPLAAPGRTPNRIQPLNPEWSQSSGLATLLRSAAIAPPTHPDPEGSGADGSLSKQ